MKKIIVLITFITIPGLNASSQADTKSGADVKKSTEQRKNITLVLDGAKGTATPVNKQTGDPLGEPIKVGVAPTEFSIAPDFRTAYVVDSWGSQLIPINLETYKAEEPIRLEYPADFMAMTPDGHTAYLGAVNTHILTAINLGTRKPLAVIPLLRLPKSIEIVGNTVYAVHSDGKATPINMETNTAGKLIDKIPKAAPQAPEAPMFTIPASAYPEEATRPAGAGSDVSATAGSSTLSGAGK